MRGGAETGARMRENIATFEQAAGTVPTLGQATESRGIRAMETALSNTIGSSGTMARRGEQQAESMAKSVRELSDQLSPGASGVDAGEAIARGVGEFPRRRLVLLLVARVRDQEDPVPVDDDDPGGGADASEVGHVHR